MPERRASRKSSNGAECLGIENFPSSYKDTTMPGKVIEKTDCTKHARVDFLRDEKLKRRGKYLPLKLGESPTFIMVLNWEVEFSDEVNRKTGLNKTSLMEFSAVLPRTWISEDWKRICVPLHHNEYLKWTREKFEAHLQPDPATFGEYDISRYGYLKCCTDPEVLRKKMKKIRKGPYITTTDDEAGAKRICLQQNKKPTLVEFNEPLLVYVSMEKFKEVKAIDKRINAHIDNLDATRMIKDASIMRSNKEPMVVLEQLNESRYDEASDDASDISSDADSEDSDSDEDNIADDPEPDFWDTERLAEAEQKALLGKKNSALAATHDSPKTVFFPSKPDENSQNAVNAEQSNLYQHSKRPPPASLPMSGSSSSAFTEPSQHQQQPGHSQNAVGQQLMALSPCATALPQHLHPYLNTPPPTTLLSMPSFDPSFFPMPTPIRPSTHQESQPMLDGAHQDNLLQQQLPPGSLQNALNAGQQLMAPPPSPAAYSNTPPPAILPMPSSYPTASSRVLQQHQSNSNIQNRILPVVPDPSAYDSAAHSHRESPSPASAEPLFPHTQQGGLLPDSYQDDRLDENTPPEESQQHRRSANSSRVLPFRSALRHNTHSPAVYADFATGAGSLGSASGSSSTSSWLSKSNENLDDHSDCDTPRTLHYRENFHRSETVVTAAALNLAKEEIIRELRRDPRCFFDQVIKEDFKREVMRDVVTYVDTSKIDANRDKQMPPEARTCVDAVEHKIKFPFNEPSQLKELNTLMENDISLRSQLVLYLKHRAYKKNQSIDKGHSVRIAACHMFTPRLCTMFIWNREHAAKKDKMSQDEIANKLEFDRLEQCKQLFEDIYAGFWRKTFKKWRNNGSSTYKKWTAEKEKLNGGEMTQEELDKLPDQPKATARRSAKNNDPPVPEGQLF